MRLENCVTLAWLSTSLLCAQSLTVPASETSLNKTGTFSVILNTPRDRAPLALQWDLSLPPVIAVRAEDITIGKAAQAAGKSLTCALRQSKKASRASRFTCIIAGGSGALSDGPVADVKYRAQWDLKGAAAQVEIENVLGVSAKLQRIPMPNVDIAIHVR